MKLHKHQHDRQKDVIQKNTVKQDTKIHKNELLKLRQQAIDTYRQNNK